MNHRIPADSPLPGPFVPPDSPTLAEAAYQRLEEMIVTLVLAPGAVFSEVQLAAQAGLGRTPVREEMPRLAREGLVRIHSRRGVQVTEINIAHQLDHLAVRRVLERLVARFAAQRATPEQRERMPRLAEEMQAAAAQGEDLAFMRLDAEFHRLSVDAAANRTLRSTMELLHGLSRRFWFAHARQVGSVMRSAELHALLMQAIANGAADEAEPAADRLMDYVERFTRAALDSGRSLP